MKLTNKQEEGLKLAIKRYKDKEPYTVISGYAGTGKTTLVHFIIAALNIPDGLVAYITYTGKAAQVLRSKGCSTAKTSHRLLYKSILNERTGKFVHIPRKYLDNPYRLIVVDEVSMLPKPIWELLLSHHIPVLALGDPGQLPPVAAESNGVLEHPHIFLDEIMRQEEESEIIQLTMNIRAGKPLELFSGKDVKIVDQNELGEIGFWKWPDQILVGKNFTRYSINSLVKEQLTGFDDVIPREGDKIICLHNSWETVNATGDALVNGAMGTISNIRPINPPSYIIEKSFMADFIPDLSDSCIFSDLEMDERIFTSHRKSKNKLSPDRWIPLPVAPKEFDFGYAITVHKSQGSEYDKVLVLEEFLKNESKNDHIKWLYTAATRAAKQLIIVRDYRM